MNGRGSAAVAARSVAWAGHDDTRDGHGHVIPTAGSRYVTMGDDWTLAPARGRTAEPAIRLIVAGEPDARLGSLPLRIGAER